MRLASRLAEKRNNPHSSTLSWVCCPLLQPIEICHPVHQRCLFFMWQAYLLVSTAESHCLRDGSCYSFYYYYYLVLPHGIFYFTIVTIFDEIKKEFLAPRVQHFRQCFSFSRYSFHRLHGITTFIIPFLIHTDEGASIGAETLVISF